MFYRFIDPQSKIHPKDFALSICPEFIMSQKMLHSTSGHLEMAAAAGSAVYATDELLQGLDEEESDAATSHYVKAAAGAAVAVGGYEMLRR